MVSSPSTDDNFRIQYTLDNVTFGPTVYPFTPTATSDTTVSVDVTSDRTWTWGDIGKLRIWLFYDMVGTADGWTGYIDSIYVQVVVGTPQYGLRWQHTVENIAPGWESYTLRVYGYRGSDEVVTVYVWDNANSVWKSIGDLPTSAGWVENAISTSYLDGDNLYVKYESADNTDSTQTTIYIDLCIVQQENVYSTSVTMEVRFDNLADMSTATPWQGVTSGQTLNVQARYSQYRATFTSEDNTLTPVLHEVRFQFT